MDAKKANIFTVIATAAALVAFTIAIAWLSANPPRTGYLSHDYENATCPPSPDETYNSGGDAPYITDNAPNDTAGSGGQYPIPPSYNNHERYTPPPYNGDAYPHYNAEEIFMTTFTREPLPEHIIRQITGVTFHETTPFGHDFLAYLTVTHVNFDGESVLGHLIVAADIAYEVLDIFREIYEGGFPIHSIKLIDYFDASDYLSMAANNSHAFNFRYIAGTNIISRHGFGVAIDINPVQNPYIRGETVWPAAGADYLDRSYVRPGMIVPGGVVYNAFVSRGWIWGGHWTLPRDYHHFERRG